MDIFNNLNEYSNFIHFFVEYYLACFRSLPFDTRTFVGFITVALFNVIIAFSCVELFVAFSAIYVGICTYIKCCIEDISMTINRSNVQIYQNGSIRAELKELIELHVNCYR